MDTAEHTPSEYTRQGFVYDIPKLLKGPPVSHPSDPWYKRPDSRAPHPHPEAHTRIGEGLVQLGTPLTAAHPAQGSRRTEVTDQPVPVTKFFK